MDIASRLPPWCRAPGRSRAAGAASPYDTIVVTLRTHEQLPELVGLAEVAEILGKSRRQAIRLVVRSDFPAPVARLRATPVWRKDEVERWGERAPLRRRRPS